MAQESSNFGSHIQNWIRELHQWCLGLFVRKVNGITPDPNTGNVDIDVVKTVNGKEPDENGDVAVTGLPIGTIFTHVSSQPPDGAWPLVGQTITSCRTLYPEFWRWLKESIGSTTEVQVYKEWTMPVLTTDATAETLGGSAYAVAPSSAVVSGYNAYESFDAITGGTGTYAALNKVTSGSLTFYSPVTLRLDKVLLKNPSNWAATHANAPSKISIYGSVDGEDYVDLTGSVDYDNRAYSSSTVYDKEIVIGADKYKHNVYRDWEMPALTTEGVLGGDDYAVKIEDERQLIDGNLYHIFDKSDSTIVRLSTGYGTIKITWYSPTPIVIDKYTIFCAGNIPDVWLLGSADGITWSLIDSRQDIAVSKMQFTPTSNNVKHFKYYQIHFRQTSDYIRVRSIDFVGREYVETTGVPGYKYYKIHSINNAGSNTDFPEITLCGQEYLYDDIVGDGPVRSMSTTAYNYIKDLIGYVNGFVIDDANGNVRLPTWYGCLPVGEKNIPVVGNGTVLGLTDGTHVDGILASSSYGVTYRSVLYGSAVGTTGSGNSTLTNNTGIGVVSDPSKSGLVVHHPSTSPDLYWYIQVFNVATQMSNQETSQLLNAVTNMAQKDLANVSPNLDFVVNSGVNGDNNWYRIYKSGWIEQGGLLATASANGQYTITLPYEMADMTYSVHTSNNNRARVDDKWDYGTVGGVRVSTTQIKLSRGRGGGPIFWEVKGMKVTSSTGGSGGSGNAGFVGLTEIDITGYVGVELVYQFDIQYGDKDVSYAMDPGSSLPAGLELDMGKITGVPTSVSTSTCKVKAYVDDGSTYVDLTININILEAPDNLDTLFALRQDFEEHNDDETRHITSNEREIVHQISNTIGGVGMPDFKRMVKMHKGFGVSWSSFPNTIYKINVPGYLYLVSTHQTIADSSDGVSRESGAADYMVYIASHPGYLFRPQCTASSQFYGQVESHFMRRCKYYTSIGHPHDNSIIVPIDPGKNTYIRILDATSAGPYHTWYFVPCVDLPDGYNPEDYFTRVGKASGAFDYADDACYPWHLGNLSDFRDEIFEGSWSDNFNSDGSLKLPIVDIFGATLVDENNTNKFIGSLSSDNRYVGWSKDNVRITEENYNEYLGYAYWPEGGLGTSPTTFTDRLGYVSVNTNGYVTYTSYEDPQLSHNGHSLILSEENKEKILSLITVTSPFGKRMIERTSADYEFYFCTYVNAPRKIFRAYKGLFKDGAFTFGPSGMSVELPYDESYTPAAANVYVVGFKEDGSRYIVGTVEYENITSVGTKLNLRLTTTYRYSGETAQMAPVGTSFVHGDSKWHLIDPIRSGDDREWLHVDGNSGHWVLRKFTSAEIDAVLAESNNTDMDVNINTYYAEARTRRDILNNMKDNWCVVYGNYDWRNLVTNPIADSAYQLSCCCYFTARKRDDYDPTLPGSNPPFGLDSNPNYTYVYDYTTNGSVTAQGFTTPRSVGTTTAGNKYCCSFMWDFGNSVASGYRDDYYLSLRPIEPTSIDTTPYW